MIDAPNRKAYNPRMVHTAVFFRWMLLLTLVATPLHAAKCATLFLNGPSLSKHFRSWHSEVRDFHWGVGAEYYRGRRWFYGLNGHAMFNDSMGRLAYWIGVAGGYRLGRTNRFWLEPSLMAGGIKKHEYRQGRFAPFALPYLALGWKRVGLNVVLIPRIAGVTQPILLVQVKARMTGDDS